MKVKVKATGEILNYEYLSNVCTGTQNSINIDEVKFIQDKIPVKSIDWEQKRFDFIKAALQGYCANSTIDFSFEQLAQISIEQADAVIKKLKYV